MALVDPNVKYPDPAPYDDWKTWASLFVTAVQTRMDEGQTGAVQEFFPPLPEGWLPADGKDFSKDSYPALAAKLGGTTLPNLTPQYAGTVVGIRP